MKEKTIEILANIIGFVIVVALAVVCVYFSISFYFTVYENKAKLENIERRVLQLENER